MEELTELLQTIKLLVWTFNLLYTESVEKESSSGVFMTHNWLVIRKVS